MTPRVIARSVAAAFLVLMAGAALGAVWHRLMPPQQLWQPRVSRSSTGWLIRDRGLGCSGLAAGDDVIAWLSEGSVLVMDLSDGKVQRLDVAAANEALSEPAASGSMVYWARGRGSEVSTGVHGDLGACWLYAWDAMKRHAGSSSGTFAARLGISSLIMVGTLLAFLWLLNVADYAITLRALSSGHAIELNGLMARLYGLGGIPAGVVKIGIVTIGTLVLWRLRRHRWVPAAVVALVLAFAALVSYEVLTQWRM